MIEVKDLHMSYRSGFMRRRVSVLSGLSFSTVDEGIVGYLGVNGAGKTTTIKILAGINPADSGEVRVLGASPADPELRGRLGYLPENPYFYEYLTPIEALDLYGSLHGLDRATRRRRAEELLARVALSHDAHRPVRGFSKGMRQRLGLAQALIHDPKLLLLDEPLTGLDAMGRLLLREIIVDERAAGRSVFFSSHVLSDVESICDAIVILDKGRVHYSGPVRELLDKDSNRGLRLRFLWKKELDALAVIPWTKAPKTLGASLEAELPPGDAGQQAISKLIEMGAELLEARALGLSLEEYFLANFRREGEKDLEKKS